MFLHFNPWSIVIIICGTQPGEHIFDIFGQASASFPWVIFSQPITLMAFHGIP